MSSHIRGDEDRDATMSLEIQTHSATKRVLEEDERLPLSDLNPQKRSKFLATTSPVGRCGNTDWNSPGEAYSVGATALLALRALFPQMDDKVSMLVSLAC